MGPVTLVERDLERLGRDEDHKLERSLVGVIVAVVRRLVRLEGEVRVRATLGRVLKQVLEVHGQEKGLTVRLAAEGADTGQMDAAIVATAKVRVGDLHRLHARAVAVEAVAGLTVPGAVLPLGNLLFRAAV